MKVIVVQIVTVSGSKCEQWVRKEVDLLYTA